MRALWVIEIMRDGKWQPTQFARETRAGARTIARAFRTNGNPPRVVCYVPRGKHAAR